MLKKVHKIISISFLLAIAGGNARAQFLEMQAGGRATSLRGLSVVTDRVVWASGSAGTVALSTDGGNNWNWTRVQGFENREFRDIEAFDDKTALVIAVGAPGQILRTEDGGRNWKVVYTDSTEGVFLDAMDFADDLHGVVAGDPLPGESFLYCLFTDDQGKNWYKAPSALNARLEVNKGEAMFAASGSNIHYLKANPDPSKRELRMITGGTRSSFISTTPDFRETLPLVQGRESTGANGLAILSGKLLLVVGGDFSRERDTTQNCAWSQDGGRTWQNPTEPPHGYRSAAAFLSRKKWVSCGLTGVDVSEDQGRHWRLISTDGFHVCQRARKGKAIFLAGSNGRIARLQW